MVTQSLAVIDDHVVAIEEIVADIDDTASQRRLDGRARGSGDVHAAMRLACFAVEHAAQAEGARTPARNRLREAQCQRRVRGEGFQRAAHFFGLTRHARLIFRREIDLVGRHLELLHGVLLGRDLERELALIGAGLLHLDVIVAGLGVERYADDGQP